MTTKFGKQLHLQNLSQLRLIKQVGAGDISTPRSLVKLKKNTFPLRIVTYLNGFLPMKSHDSLITWSCEII